MQQYPNQVMKIIVPTAPHTNSSKKVSKQTLLIMQHTFKQAYEMIQNIFKGNNQWVDLFTHYQFLDEFNDFVEINIVGKDVEKFTKWKGFIKSQLWVMCEYLTGKRGEYKDESETRFMIRPYPIGFDDKKNYRNGMYRNC